jgi:hypothetical protein
MGLLHQRGVVLPTIETSHGYEHELCDCRCVHHWTRQFKLVVHIGKIVCFHVFLCRIDAHYDTSTYTGPRTKEIIIEIPTDDPDFINNLDMVA